MSALIDQLIGGKPLITEAMDEQDWLHAIKGLGEEGLEKALKTLSKGKLKKLYYAGKGETAPAGEGGESEEAETETEEEDVTHTFDADDKKED